MSVCAFGCVVVSARFNVKAVQTLSRLNRAHPEKHDVFVLDFMNDVDVIRESFADYYRTTVLSEETDPNKLHDLKAALDGYQVYAPNEIDAVVEAFLAQPEKGPKGRTVRNERLDAISSPCLKTKSTWRCSEIDWRHGDGNTPQAAAPTGPVLRG